MKRNQFIIVSVMFILITAAVFGDKAYAAGTITDQSGNTYTTLAAALSGNPSELTISGEIDNGGNQIVISPTGPLTIVLDDASFTDSIRVTNTAALEIRGNGTFKGILRFEGTGDKVMGDGSGDIKVVDPGHMEIAEGKMTVNSDVTVAAGTQPGLTILGTADVIVDGGSYSSRYQAIQVRGPARAALKNIEEIYSADEAGAAVEALWGAKISEITNCTISGGKYGIWATYQYPLGASREESTTSIDKIAGCHITSRATNGQPAGIHANETLFYNGYVRIGTIENCTITANAGSIYGGGIYAAYPVSTDATRLDQESWKHVTIDSVKNCTITANNSASGIVSAGATIGDLEENTVEATGNGRGVNLYFGKVGNIVGGTYKCPNATGGSVIGNAQGVVGDITGVRLQGNYAGIVNSLYESDRENTGIIGNITDCSIEAKNNAGISNNNGTMGNISNCTITSDAATGGNAIASVYNAGGRIGDIEGSAISSRASYGILNSAGTIKGIKDCTINAEAQTNFGRAVRNLNQGEITDGIKSCTISAGYVGINNHTAASTTAAPSASRIGGVENCAITVSGLPDGKGWGVLNEGGIVDHVKDCNEITAPVGVCNYGVMDTVSGNTIHSVKTGIEVNGSAKQYAYYEGKTETLSDNIVESSAAEAVRVAAGGRLGGITSGTYVGETNGVTDEGTLNSITGDPVFWGRTGYAVDNTKEEAAITIEPGISPALHGSARYKGAGTAANEQIADPGKDTYPEYEPQNIRYSMSFGTTPVDGLGDGFHYLTVNCTVTYDANGGDGDMSDKKYEGEWTDSLKAESNVFTREGYTFAKWNTEADGSGTSYSAGDVLQLNKTDIRLYAQWEEKEEEENPKEKYTITYRLDGGTYNGSTEDIKEVHEDGTTIKIHEAPERKGYTFLYWEGSRYDPGDEYKVKKDHTFTAKWKKKASGGDSGSSMPSAQPPATPTEEEQPAQETVQETVMKEPVREVGRPEPRLETGDEKQLRLWQGLLILSVCGLIAFVRKNRRGDPATKDGP
ncbi:MAG: InlB B-repeat-containing protein [Lachnospiraceae bacterium]|nr:InlB B-repeat-containing protein [Lachnospiraceae bacterium]